MSTGDFNTCGRTTDARVFCWGMNHSGQLGDGTQVDRPTPTAQAVSVSFAQISVGDLHGCSVTTEGRAYCWGDNHGGQLGNGTTSIGPSPFPTPVAAPQ